MKRWKKYAEIFEEDCQIFLKRSSLLSASRFGIECDKRVKEQDLWKKMVQKFSKRIYRHFLKRMLALRLEQVWKESAS
ncbi:hypothetical protein DBT40_05165 [Aerococcus tenax]|nr:hypothetical protein DBT40_05165 [Aerococcus urinae]RAW04894.1 hypothetical protein DBT41_03385 [Aerococcus urinae]